LPRIKRKLLIAPFNNPDGTELLFRTALDSGVEPNEIVYITPSPRNLRQAQIIFTRIYNKKAFIPPQFFTPRHLAFNLHERFNTSRYLPKALKPLLVLRLLTQPGTGDDEKTRKPTIGYAQVVANFIADIKRHIPRDEWVNLSDRFSRLLAGYEKPRQRLGNACNVMTVYNKKLTEKNWADDEDIIASAPAQIKQAYPVIKVLLLDSFVAPNYLEKELLNALINQAEITIALGFGSREDHPAYRLARTFTDFITAQGGFSTKYLPTRQVAPPSRFWRFPSIEDEIAGICRHIHANWQKLQTADTYVIFNRLEKYAPLVQRMFARYEIPFTIYPENRLSVLPTVATVLELLKALNSDYERVATTAAFASPFLPGLLRLPEDPDETRRDLSALALNQYSRRAGIIKGKENWKHIADHIIRTEELEADDPELPFLKELQKRVRQAIGITEKILQPAATVGKQAHRLKQFLAAVGFGKTLNPGDDIDYELLETRKALYDILDRLADFETEFGAREEKRNDFIKLLAFIIDQQMRTPEAEQPGVKVLSMKETLGITATNLYLGALTEEDLPGAYQADPLLPEWVRKELGMPDIEWHRDWERFHFHRTLNSSINPPWLSYHETRDGNPVLPTPFLQEIPSPPETILADNSLCTAIYSKIEHQLYLGRKSQTRLEELAVNVDFSQTPEVLDEINRRFGPDQEISVTALEHYRRCPFLFYLERVLGLKEIPEPGFDIAAQEWGLIVHDVLSRIYKNKDKPVPIKELPQAVEKALTAVLQENPLSPFWREVIFRVFKNILEDFCKKEQQLREEGFLPFKTELTLRGNVASYININVKGRIDRIDAANNRLRIIDYKTGSNVINAKAITEKRTHIQLPLYAHLIQNHQDFAQKEVDNIGIHSLTEINWLAQHDTPLTELIKAALNTTYEVVTSIREGKFPAKAADEAVCSDCDLAFTCGYRRNEKKSSEV